MQSKRNNYNKLLFCLYTLAKKKVKLKQIFEILTQHNE